MSLPTGTITFLFTDIEGSTRMWDAHPEAMRVALARHDRLMRRAIENNSGYVFKMVGDAFCAAFVTAPDALAAALEAHQSLAAEDWEVTGPIRVRMGIHTGAAEERDNDYFGPTLNRTARLQALAHGQQTLITLVTYELVRGSLPSGASLSDMGMHRLKDLASPEHVWQLLHTALQQEFPPIKSLDYLPNNLPLQLTSFVGRETEMTQIKTLLQNSRLVTLTGSGGTGKTRLSLQVSADVLEQYADGVWMVELAAIADPLLVPQAVAQSLNVSETPGEPITHTLLAALKGKHILLVLDNCEHVLGACARLIDGLLKSCAKVTVLASSREALGITGENSYRVPSLSVPDLKQAHTSHSLSPCESARLFIERAVAVRSDFTITQENAPSIASVCIRLDGIPLAIELASARLRSLTVEQIEQNLDKRFRLLTGGSRTALPRQQTLRAMIDWSYDLLNTSEKAMLCQASVFAGGWTLEAAMAACGCGDFEEFETLEMLTALVDKSLVLADPHGDSVRYRLLETVRQYAGDKLSESGESETVRCRHLAYFLEFAEEAEPNMKGREQAKWLQQLDEEHDNMRAALEWSLVHDSCSHAGVRLCGALRWFWWVRGHLAEGRDWCDRLLEITRYQEQSLERASALGTAGLLAKMQGDIASSFSYHDASLLIRKAIGDLPGIAASLNSLGGVAIEQADYESARAYCAECLAINRELGHRPGVAGALLMLGIVAHCRGDYASAEARYKESLDIQREIGNPSGISAPIFNLGNVSFEQGNYASAHKYYSESLALKREIGDRSGIASSLAGLGVVASARADYGYALDCFDESCTIYSEIGERPFLANTLCSMGDLYVSKGEYATGRTLLMKSLNIHQEVRSLLGIAGVMESFAGLAAKENKPDRAGTLWAAAESLRHQVGSPRSPISQAEYDRCVARVRSDLGEESFSVAWAKGQGMAMQEAIDIALGETL